MEISESPVGHWQLFDASPSRSSISIPTVGRSVLPPSDLPSCDACYTFILIGSLFIAKRERDFIILLQERPTRALPISYFAIVLYARLFILSLSHSCPVAMAVVVCMSLQRHVSRIPHPLVCTHTHTTTTTTTLCIH